MFCMYVCMYLNFVTILQLRQLEPRGLKHLVSGLTGSEWQSEGSDPGLCVLGLSSDSGTCHLAFSFQQMGKTHKPRLVLQVGRIVQKGAWWGEQPGRLFVGAIGFGVLNYSSVRPGRGARWPASGVTTQPSLLRFVPDVPQQQLLAPPSTLRREYRSTCGS